MPVCSLLNALQHGSQRSLGLKVHLHVYKYGVFQPKLRS